VWWKRVKQVVETEHPWDTGVSRRLRLFHISYSEDGPGLSSQIQSMLSEASAHVEILHHRRPVLTQQLWENLLPSYITSKKMPRNGKNHNSEFKFSPLTTDRHEITMRGRLKIEII